MLTKSKRAQQYADLFHDVAILEKDLEGLTRKLNAIYLEPFKTWATFSNASYVLSGVLRSPDTVFRSAWNLRGVKGDCLMFSGESMDRHIGRIFKHFKEVGFLVKARSGGYKLNPLLKGLAKQGGK